MIGKTQIGLLLGIFLFCSLKGQEPDTIPILQENVSEVQILSETMISVIPPDFLEEELVTTNFETLINQENSVFIKNYGVGQLATISYRGLNASQTNISWNGLQLNSPMLGQTDLSMVPLAGADKIEWENEESNLGKRLNVTNNLTTGFPSTFFSIHSKYGSNAHLISNLNAVFQRYRCSSETSFNYEYAKNNFKYQNPTLPNSPTVRLENAKINRYTFAQSVSVGRLNKLQFHYFHSYADREIPPTLFETSSTESQKDIWHGFTTKYLLFKENKEKYTGSVQSGFTFQRLDFYLSQNAAPEISKIATWQSQIDFNMKINQFLDWENKLDITLKSGKTINYIQDQQRWRGGAQSYLSYRWLEKDLKFKAGLASQFVGKDFSLPLPSIDMNYNRHQKGNIFFNLNYSQHQRFPTMNDLYWNPGGNENLKAEHSHNLEASMIFNGEFRLRENTYSQHRFESKTNVFSIWATDYIQWQPTSQGYWAPQNIGDINTRGVEQELTFDFFTQSFAKIWHLGLSYSYTRATNRTTSDSYQLIYVPKHQLQLENKYFNKIVNVGIRQSFTSKNYVSIDNQNYIKAFYLLDLSLEKQLFLKNQQRLDLNFQLRNIFNQEYQTVINRPLQGINFEFNVIYQFMKH